MPRSHIALHGRSGAGKTEVADYLVRRYGYYRCSTGQACRELCSRLFESEAKGLLNLVTDALRKIDEDVWLRAALKGAPAGVPIIFDSMRFMPDYKYLSARGFRTWHIDASLPVRVARLRARGQEFDPERDDSHAAEVELEAVDFDVTFHNEDGSLVDLFGAVDRELLRPALGGGV